ncbi:uncharacterized protein LOC119780581 [Cyprinodon tularosa]|uniref:uncharacterized protein LOC119780581 n=1 Tax=Cyprinodon tularosa TaxID=77115 RepID=UPI0018E22C36|nr:uncharacterized protein LOC119780581 [Cyprinodon tularosa]
MHCGLECKLVNSKISTDYEDIISASELLQSGPPAVYQLKSEKELIGTLKRMTVGKRNPTKVNKTILLVGETGTGKSTLINTLVNHAIGVKFRDDVWFQIVEEEDRSQAESQTSDVIVYQIFGFEGKTLPFSLTIIDTPGYGDTRGLEKDAIVRQRLLDLFSSEGGVEEINMVGLVVKASVNRVSSRLRYIFDSVMSLFAKDLENSIVALMTFSDGRLPRDALQALEAADIKMAKNEKGQPLHFLFNNCQAETRDEEEEDSIEYAWRQTAKGLEKFVNFLEKTGPKKLKTTKEVLNSQIRLTASIHNLQERIKSAEKMKDEIEKTKIMLERFEKDLIDDKNFTIEVIENYKSLESYNPESSWSWLILGYDGVTRCEICEENCHYPGCTMAWVASHCVVMSNGRCNVCTQSCSAEKHVKDTQRYVNKTRTVKKTLDDVKKKYTASVRDTSSVLRALDQKMEEVEKEITQWLDEAFRHVLKIKENALSVRTVSTEAYLGVLIRRMKQEGDVSKIKILEEMAGQVDEGTSNLLRRIFNEA